MKTKYDYWSNAKNELCKPTVLDGRLSAAILADSAPDLLAALEAMVATWEGPRELAALRFAKNVVDARAAIARARGE